MGKSEPEWPPENGRRFVRSERFGELLVAEATALAEAHRDLDFVDAVATAYAWFTRRLNQNAHFINKRRFPTMGRFRAYVRQSLFNAAQMARRSRKKGQPLAAVPADRQIVDAPKLSIEEREKLLQLVEKLEEPTKSVFERIFFAETDVYLVAGSLDMDEGEIVRIYEQALDRLTKLSR